MNIQEVEKLTGITKQNIRFYEREGLISPNRNAVNAYREYSDKDIHDIKIIKLLRKLDMPLPEIKQVLEKEESLEIAVKRQQERLEIAKSDLEAAISSCKKISEYQIDTLDVDKELADMEEVERHGGKFAALWDDFKLAALLEWKWNFAFTPYHPVKTPKDFTNALFEYANNKDLHMVITKEGMNPEFTLEGVQCIAEKHFGDIRCWAKETNYRLQNELSDDALEEDDSNTTEEDKNRVKNLRLLYRLISTFICYVLFQGLSIIFLGMNLKGIIIMIMIDIIIIICGNVWWWRKIK